MGEIAPPARAVEDFPLDPTEMSDRYAESRSLTLNTRQCSGQQLASNTEQKPFHTLKERFSDPLLEQLYWRGYNSDEEDLSGDDSDTMSISSASSGEILEMTPTRLSIISAEVLQDAKRRSLIDQTVCCAQAVTFKPINHGDIILSPRLVDIPPSPRSDRSQSISHCKPPTSRLAKLDMSKATRHQRSVHSTPRTSLEESSNASTPSTPPTSVDDRSPVSSSEKVIRRKSAVHSMRGVARREYSVKADNQALREFLATDPSTHTKPLSYVPAHMAPPSKRKLRKFSSSFSLGRFTKRKDTPESSSDELPTLSTLNRQKLPAPEVYRPTRCSSLQPPPTKMVARGGNERAPPVVLPPCPDGSEDDVGPMRGPMRRAPKSYAPTGAPKPGRKLHRRQRSLSADDIMMAS